MKKVPELLEEPTLDPADWEGFKQLGHRMLEDMFHYLQTSRQRLAWQKPPVDAIGSMQQPLPQWPEDPAAIYEQFFTQVLPYNTENAHPRFWSWVQGGGTPLGMLADMLASGMNTNVSIGDHMPMYVEKQVIDWSKEMMGFPATAGGILLSGASLANITALVVARNHFHDQVRKKGLQAVPAQMTMYGSAETHNCVIKGVEVIGIGSDNFRKVPVDADYRVRVDLLRHLIREDREAGLLPFCIVGNAGTVNTGSIDPLDELAAVAREEGLWFHVDGAFGAIPKILPEFDDRLKGIEQADSLSFDYHKWLYVNYEVACVLIRDASIHRAAFASTVTYLVQHERGLSGGPDPVSNYGMELSRGFKALKVWMSIKEHGIDRYRQMIRKNLRQAQYLAGLIDAETHLELLSPIPLNIVCFRYNPGGLSDEALNQLNKEILMSLHEQGIAAPSYTLLQGKYAIRAAITNHRSRMEDFDILTDAVLRIGKAVNQ